jgi:hypothetical protein
MILDVGNDEFVSVGLFSELLRERVSKELRPKIGETLTLLYGGVRQNKTRKNRDGSPTEYHVYLCDIGTEIIPPETTTPWETHETVEPVDIDNSPEY